MKKYFILSVNEAIFKTISNTDLQTQLNDNVSTIREFYNFCDTHKISEPFLMNEDSLIANFNHSQLGEEVNYLFYMDIEMYDISVFECGGMDGSDCFCSMHEILTIGNDVSDIPLLRLIDFEVVGDIIADVCLDAEYYVTRKVISMGDKTYALDYKVYNDYTCEHIATRQVTYFKPCRLEF